VDFNQLFFLDPEFPFGYYYGNYACSWGKASHWRLNMCLLFSRYSGRASPCILFNIPDGHVKEMPTTGSKHKAAAAAKESSPAAQPSSAKEV
jgi:hypothetical protein